MAKKITTEKVDRYTVKIGKDVIVNENNIAEQMYLTYIKEGYVEITGNI